MDTSKMKQLKYDKNDRLIKIRAKIAKRIFNEALETQIIPKTEITHIDKFFNKLNAVLWKWNKKSREIQIITYYLDFVREHFNEKYENKSWRHNEGKTS
jgi:hypothetical protein